MLKLANICRTVAENYLSLTQQNSSPNLKPLLKAKMNEMVANS